MWAVAMVCLRTLGANIPYQGINEDWMQEFASSFKSFGKAGRMSGF
jgi:preprotein translocase subunit SecY